MFPVSARRDRGTGSDSDGRAIEPYDKDATDEVSGRSILPSKKGSSSRLRIACTRLLHR